MRIAIAGTGRLGASLLRPLLRSSHQVVAIVQDGRKKTPFRRWIEPAIGQFVGGPHHMPGWAAHLGIPLIWLDKMNHEALTPLRALDPDILLVGGFSIILKPPIINLPRIGCVNTHSSLLPRHRGPNPFCAVILAGETESGVTFHILDEGIDTGPIIEQTAFPIGENEGAFDIYNHACDIAAERVVDVMDKIEREGLHGTPQDPDRACYDQKPTEKDTWIDWRKSAVEIDRLVRALSPMPMPRFLYGETLVRVARTRLDMRPTEAAPGTVLANRPFAVIATGKGAIRLHVAYANSLVPWLWPAPWQRPRIGSILPAAGPPQNEENG